MNILIDARMYGLENTGIGRYVMNLISQLSMIDTKNSYTVMLQKKYYSSIELPKNFKKILADFGYYSLGEQVRLHMILFKIRPDLCHFPHFNIPYFWSGKFIVTLHDMTMHKTGSESSNLALPLYWVKKLFYKLMVERAVNKSVKVIVPTNTVKKEILEYFKIAGTKVVPIYEGFNEQFNTSKNINLDKMEDKYGIKKYEYIIYTGNVYPHKNIRKVVDTLKHLKESGLILKLVLVTKNNKFLEKIMDYAKEKKIDKQIVLIGFLTDEDLNLLYSKSLAFIYPSLAEGFGLQGLEALASGAKLLASDIDVFKEVYGDCAFYFDPLNPYSISNAIKKVKISEQKPGVKEMLGKYSWAKMAQDTLKIYNSYD